MGSQSWFEQAEARAKRASEQQELGEDSAADVDVETATLRSVGSEAQADHSVSLALPPEPTQRPRSTRPRRSAGKKIVRERTPNQRSALGSIAVAGAAIMAGGALIIGTAAAMILFLRDNEEPTPQALKPSPEVSAAEKVGYAGQCADASGKTPVAQSRTDLRGTVVAFETAYYNRDASALLETVAADSGLAATEWDDILDEAAPEGTTWCATLQPPKGNSVDIDLVVTSPDGDEETYRQRVSGRQIPGSQRWQLIKIDSRL